jgi:molybdopterin molybdotransferase
MTQDTELLDVSEARRRLLEHFSPLDVNFIPVTAAIGHVLAEAIKAPYDLPLFPNSSMDGFAVHSADVAKASVEHPVALHVVGDISAGKVVNRVLQAGESMRIMTGAMVPEGADAVVPVEDTDHYPQENSSIAPHVVRVFRPTDQGGNIRPVGQDVRQGDIVVQAGQFIRPQEAGFLSMLGQTKVPVHRRPRVAVFSSGDELVPVDETLTPGKIHDANSIMLVGLVERCGGEAVYLGIIPDRPEAVENILEKAVLADVDLIVSSAGVSVGALDYIRSTIEKEGKLVFWRVNMRPGKPLAFGYFRDVPFVGLPGNPVSAYVGFEIFLRPVVRKMLGTREQGRPTWRARLLEPIDSDGRESYLRAIVSWQDGEPMCRLTGHQGSGNLRSLVRANALLFVPSGVKYVPSGAQVDVLWLDDW